MKLTYLLTINFCIFSYLSNAQNKTLGVGTATPNPNAALHVESQTANQGFIMPRLTTVQRTAVPLNASDNGLMVYDTDFKSIFMWNGSAWVASSKIILPYKDSLVDVAQGTAPLLYLKNAGTTANGTSVAYFHNSNPNSNGVPLFVSNEGTGNAGVFASNNPLQNGPNLNAYTESTLSTSAAFTARTGVTGLGTTATFRLDNPNNPSNTLVAENKGLGRAGNFFINNTANTSAAIRASTNGEGSAAFFENTNTTATGATGLLSRINTNTSGTAIDGQSFGLAGHGGSFITTNANNTFSTLNSVSQGLGNAASFSLSNSLNASPALNVTTAGIGNGGYFEITNNTSTAAAISAIHKGNSGGTAIYSEHQGSAPGFAGIFRNGNASNSFPALVSETIGTGGAGEFKIINPSNSGNSLYSVTNGTGLAIYGETTNTANTGAAVFGVSNSSSVFAANFRNTNTSSSGGAIYLVTYSLGSTAVVNHRGSSGDIIEFQNQDARIARIDKTGKGFFNGGTQTGGADLAEMFDVEGEANEYEPGDVLVISESTDRTVEKCTTPNSTKVAGVYATKPGVILTERDIEENLDDLVPMGVVGVIPTKVCLESGPIKRGDLLVTSSVKGHAMKANPVIINGVEIYPTGAILGKALENFDSGNTGLIKVLVNVK